MLHQKKPIPLIHLDRLFWQEHWQARPQEVFEQQLNTALKKKQWIKDGHYQRTLAQRLKYTDTVIFLDYPNHVALSSWHQRLYNNRPRSDMPDHCPETWSQTFENHIRHFKTQKRPEVMQLLETFSGQLYVFQSREEATDFLENLKG